MHSFTFNGHNSEEFGIRVERYPDLNRSARKYKSSSVPGRNGNIYQMEDAWEEVTVSYKIFAGEREEGAAIVSFTDIMEWLHSADDYAVLTDTYDPSHYRLGVYVDAIDIESEWHTFAQATIKFRCRPQRFLVRKTIEVADGDIIENPTNHIAKPIITLTGSEIVPSILDLEMPYNITYDSDITNWNPQWLTNTFFVYNSIATLWDESQKMTFRTYRTEGASQNGGQLITNDNSTGTLKFLPFRYGSYNVGIGRGIALTPDTDYTLSYTVSTGANVTVCFFDMDGSKTYNSLKEYRSSSGSHSFKFHVPVTCSNTLIIFYSTNNVTITFSEIMLANGTEVLPFVPYGGGSTETFTINDITLSFDTTGFTTAVIDCEREDFTVDGANANASATIIDQYGNLSPTFLQLDKGDNVISYSENITSVTIEPRLWEL